MEKKIEIPVPAIVSFTFDDGWLSQHLHALPILEAFDVKATFYIITKWLTKKSPLYMSAGNVLDVWSSGHEIGSHSVTHPSLPFSFGQRKQIELSKYALETFIGEPVKSFAYPYGRYTQSIAQKAEDAGYKNARAVSGFFNGYNTRDIKCRFAISCKSVKKDTTIEEVKGWIIAAKEQKMWLVLNFHQIVDTPYKWGCTRDMLYLVCEAVKNSGARVLPISKAFEAYYEK